MDKNDFLLQQYLTLRDEVKETKSRIFKLAGFGIIGMPSAYFLAHTYKLDILIISLPILICTILLLFLAESRALMRCGLYIKEHIETELVSSVDINFIGWEHWLEQKQRGKPGRRIVDILVVVFFYTLFLFYYIASVALAAQTCGSKYGTIGLAVVLGAYIGLGIIFVGFLLFSLKHSTSTSSGEL